MRMVEVFIGVAFALTLVGLLLKNPNGTSEVIKSIASANIATWGVLGQRNVSGLDVTVSG